MTWQNVTVFVPPANDTHLHELIAEAQTNGCWWEARYCPRVPIFLHHHIVKKSNFPPGKKVKTLAGNKIWWTQVGEDRYVMPQGTKVLLIEDRLNGQRWHIEKSLQY